MTSGPPPGFEALNVTIPLLPGLEALGSTSPHLGSNSPNSGPSPNFDAFGSPALNFDPPKPPPQTAKRQRRGRGSAIAATKRGGGGDAADKIDLFAYGVKLLIKGYEAAAVIGAKGASVRAIRASSSATVKVLSAEDGGVDAAAGGETGSTAARDRVVLLQGGPFAVHTALVMVCAKLLEVQRTRARGDAIADADAEAGEAEKRQDEDGWYTRAEFDAFYGREGGGDDKAAREAWA